VRALQAAVFRDHIHYAFTLRENVGDGRPKRADQVEAVEAVEAVAARGGADAVAEALPDDFEGGAELSGG